MGKDIIVTIMIIVSALTAYVVILKIIVYVMFDLTIDLKRLVRWIELKIFKFENYGWNEYR